MLWCWDLYRPCLDSPMKETTGNSKYTRLQKKYEYFKIGIVSRKRLKLKPKCPRCDDNAPELYLLKNMSSLTSGCCINRSSKTPHLSCLSDLLNCCHMGRCHHQQSKIIKLNGVLQLSGFTEHLEIYVTRTK